MNIFSDYDRFVKAYPANESLAAFRQAGQDYAVQKGLPTRKDEDWHYTSVKTVNELKFSADLGGEVPLSSGVIAEVKKNLNPQFTNVVFVNGVLEKSLTDDLPFGFTLKEDFEFPTKFDDAFDAVNGAYSFNPLNISLAKETVVEKPVNFLFFAMASANAPRMLHPRLQINIGARSSVRILESYYGDHNSRHLVNSVVELNVAESAKVIYARVQADAEAAFNIGRTRINVAKDATLETMAFSVGSQLSRHSLEVALQGPGSTSGIFGVYATRGTQHTDNTTLIDHQVGECSTEQLYKGILDNESRAVFAGKVLIQKGAQKANSSQLNNNLLLSQKAEADSKPMLDIYADDVKAAHGSTVGQLNKEELFYLLSRAIPKQKAVSMLSYGFLSEVIYKISDEKIQQWLSMHLDQAFARLQVSEAQRA